MYSLFVLATSFSTCSAWCMHCGDWSLSSWTIYKNIQEKWQKTVFPYTPEIKHWGLPEKSAPNKNKQTFCYFVETNNKLFLSIDEHKK